MITDIENKIEAAFKTKFKRDPIVIKSPGRINLIGEHTDYNDGFVFPAAIDKGIVAAFQKSEDQYCHAIAFDQDQTHRFLLDKIEPIQNGGWENYVIGVVAEIQKAGKKVEPFNVVFGGDIPIGAGLSSSAALENSIVFGLNELFELGLSKNEMILISQRAEHNYALVRCGIMDQYASMFGKVNSALLLDCRTVKSKDFKIDLGEYELLLINTHVNHSLNDSAYNDRRQVCEKAAHLLGIKALRDATEESLLDKKQELSEEDYQKALYIIQENKRVQQASKMIIGNDIIGLGELLYKSHYGLQNQYKVSCIELDFLVDQARGDDKAIGARMMGGGFGGCTLNIIRKSGAEKFKEKLLIAYQKEYGKSCSFYPVALSQGTHLIK